MVPHLRAAHGRKTPATHVDHILSHLARSDLAADPANMQSLCATCHNAKTKRTDRGFGGPHGRTVAALGPRWAGEAPTRGGAENYFRGTREDRAGKSIFCTSTFPDFCREG